MIRINILIFLFSISLFSQKKNLDNTSLLNSFFDEIEQLNISSAAGKMFFIKDSILQKKVSIYFDLKKNNGFKFHSSVDYINNIKLDRRKKDIYYLLDLLIITENERVYNKNRIKAFDIAQKGYHLSEELNYNFLKRIFTLQILKIYKSGIINPDDNVNFYIDELFSLSKNNNIYLFKYYLYKIYLNEMGVLKGDDNTKIETVNTISNKLILKLDSLSNTFNSYNKLRIEYYHIKGLKSILKIGGNSIYCFQKELDLLEKESHVFYNKYKYELYKEIARNYTINQQYELAVANIEESKKYESKITPLRNDFVYHLYKSDMYYGLNNKDSAFIALKKAFQNSFLINFKNQNNLISSLEIKNKTVEKEKQIFELDSKRKQNLSFLIVTLSSLILISIIAALSLKNSKRKRKLAEKEKELETIKNLTLLKEQEITTINAMVDGQEKERKRIAEDLHDNLGSVLATLKLHFENLKINREKKKIDQKELFNKTENLIDEAYLKVRRIAHAKNAGVIANQGLLLAIQMMAEKISSADKIQIDVIHFGLDKRLENTLEITLFRIIQELVTNIIKHADAKNATINISLYDKNLNIIIEDDGKGFDIKKVNLNNGMGINSIKTRIEHLNGSFKVDSTLGKGSSIILDIPIL
ncbi:sensor histidine kinase [Polaribacter vadi]|uniref:sensor histidine kinase n=1 Tax=Polaribacter TaxID=52959 RepID=UPI001C07FEA8|nr:sensor histidine kinase [Polaribacter sp. 1_MG-2023]MBU3012550.1 sensor histidine kinase [Polaribacter vadi]MDO6742367.1 sensor histidine kinase [Polaribacter sp. 1_MG-2023]